MHDHSGDKTCGHVGGMLNQKTGTPRIRSRIVPPPTPVMTASHMNPITSMPLRDATNAPDTANTMAPRTSKKGNNRKLSAESISWGCMRGSQGCIDASTALSMLRLHRAQ